MRAPAASILHYAEETRKAAVGHQCAGVESNREESAICTTTTTTKHNKIILDKKESQQSEKQILVDPVSLRESAAIMHQTMMYPVTTGPKLEIMSVPLHHLQQLPPPPPPAAAAAASAAASSSSKFMSSCSLPNSASSSLHFDLTFTKHKKKYKKHQQGTVSSLARPHSVALSNLEQLRESHLRRSKSCGEGRACQPSVDFDLWSSTNHQTDIYNHGTEVVRVEEKREEGKTKTFDKRGGPKEAESLYEDEDKFKCGACLFLPGLGKGKTVMRARKEVEEDDHERGGGMAHMDVVSQRVSLEKFECGSWRSSAIIHCEEDGDPTSSLFFDLPVELIRCSSVNDTESPITTGFVFDNKDHHQHHHRKGVLKSTTTSTTMITSTTTSGQPRRKSHESCNSSRHVRFSTSSPTPTTSPTSSCITPRLRKARDDFNSLLEAQRA